ncbi:MAG: universal stress protein [Thermodesulfobacteriota bacterium]
MSSLFLPFRLGSLELRNRLVAVPVFTGYALPGGQVSGMLIDHYRRLAGTGVAMVVVANAAVAQDGCTSLHNLRVDRDAQIDGLRELAGAIRREGAAACLQLNHAGRFARGDRPLLPTPVTGKHLAFQVASLTDFVRSFPLEKRFALTQRLLLLVNRWTTGMEETDMRRVARDFALAAQRAWQAGFDCVELHGASGYLLNQFLSAFTNTRPSAIQGGLPDRLRFPLEVLQAVKQRLPESFPVGFRLQLREWVPEGIEPDEAAALATRLQQERIAYLSVSAGSYNSYFSADYKALASRPAYLREDAAGLRKRLKTPVILAGRILDAATAEQLLDDGVTDLIGLGRPLRTDDRWLEKARQGLRITPCVDCGSCLKRVTLDQGFACARWPAWRRNRTDLEHKLLKRNPARQLWAITAPEDAAVFQRLLDWLAAPEPVRHVRAMFLPDASEPESLVGAEEPFRRWLGANRSSEASVVPRVADSCMLVSDDPANAILEAVVQGGYGMILVARNRDAVWQERLMHRLRGRVFCLAGPGKKPFRMLVLLDLSDTSLLVIKCLDRLLAHRPEMAFDCVHVLSGTAREAATTWKRMGRILGLERGMALELIESGPDVPAALLRKIREDGYSLVVMGKRGLSGIKRLVLGSVSAGVMQGLEDETLVLID